FRIVTIDSGILLFEDVRFDQPIYTVISNQKVAKFKTPREPLYRLSQKLLFFFKSSVVNVSVSIDSQFFGTAIQSIDNKNLYVPPWNASFIMMDIVAIIIALWVHTIILTFFRYRAKRMTQSCCVCFTLWNTIRLRMVLLCSIDLFYYSLVGLALYHFIGPWYIGYLTDGYFGAAFLWGTIIKGMYLPPDMQTYMGTIQLVLFLFPFTLCLCSSCYYRYIQLQSSIDLAESNCNRGV
ncbi:unnamed protein product, partial [Rotaria sordida]